MFYVVFPFARGWVEGYFSSLEKAKAYISNVGFTGWVYMTETDDFVCEQRPY